jgi:methanogenic corrinoid protein MtbC1
MTQSPSTPVPATGAPGPLVADLDSCPVLPGLSVAAVARRLGVAPATLRTWDRRYALGPSQRAAGSHRRYSAIDIARLDLMRRLVNTGVPPGDAARAALTAAVTAVDAEDDLLGPVEGLDVDPRADLQNLVEVRPATAAAIGSAVRGLMRAATSLDSTACAEIIAASLESRGVVWTWDQLLTPVLVGVGRLWQDTGRGVEVEHVLSEAISAGLTGVVARIGAPVNPRPVLLACVADELHALPLQAVAAALAERRIAARVLGARVPHEALVTAIRRTGPAVVLLWSHAPRPDLAADLGALPVLRPAPLVLAAGPGWGDPLPSGMARVVDLVDAVTRISRAAGD